MTKEILLDVFAQDTTPLEATNLGLPLLKGNSGARPRVTCDGLADFKVRFQALSGNVLSAIDKIPGITFAGGSVVGALTGGSISDLDIFLVAAPEQAPVILEQIYEAVQKQDVEKKKGRQLLLARSKHAVPRRH